MDMKLTYIHNQNAADAVASELTAFSDTDLFHIDVYGIAGKLKLDRKTVLNIFIQGVHDGHFLIDWIYHCPTCGTVVNESLSVHEAVSEDFCPACQKSFTNTLDDNIEVFFSIHPALNRGDPSLKQEYKAAIDSEVTQGKYCTWKNPNAIRAVDLIQNDLYRSLMGSDVLPFDQSLRIMKSVILFTDIKGSTRMYEELGDAKAFALVREHFKILFDVIKRYDGVPIKTIGDAVMGVFTYSEQAVKAALEAQEELIKHYAQKDNNEKIEVKIGMHTGPAIVVTLNDRLDYFGSTVNTAARIQGAALPNEVVVSEELFDNKEVKRAIASVTKTVQRQHIRFKGMQETSTIYHIKMS